MKRQWSEMKYDRWVDCWLVVLGGREYILHCGEWFDLSFGEKSVVCRLERDRKWYVIMNELRFYLHPKQTYKIEQ